MKKSILILGAGIYQVPLIKKAKDMGLETIVCSIKGHYPGFQYADKVYYINTTDKEACLDIAIHENISGVCTSGTDVAIPTLGHINDKMSLHGLNEEAALLSSDKALMKSAFQKGNVNTAKFQIVSNLEECISAVEFIGVPCIFKVVDSSGSRGMEIVRDKESVQVAFCNVFSQTKKNKIVVEEYLNGIEYGAQAFVDHGTVHLIMPHSDEVYNSGIGVPIAHNVPALLYGIDDTIYESEKAIKALKIDNSAVNLDFIFSKGKTYVLEVGARSGATGLAELVSIHYGVDYYQMIIETALGTFDFKKYDFTPKMSASSMLVISEKKGTLLSYNPIFNKNLVDFSMDYEIGDTIPKFRKGPDRIGHIIVSGKSQPETNILAHKLSQDIHIVVG